MAEKTVMKPVRITVCDICGNEIPQGWHGSKCCNCGKDICLKCMRTHTDDYSVCVSLGCATAAKAIHDWYICKKYNDVRCEECNEALTCNMSYIKHPEYLEFTKFG